MEFYGVKEKVAAATFSALALASCMNDNQPESTSHPTIVVGVNQYEISQPPDLEQFNTCNTYPEAVYIDTPSNQEIRDGVSKNLITLNHIVGLNESLESIASCYFEQPEYGLMSIKSSNIITEEPNQGETLIIRLSNPMSFITNGVSGDVIVEQTGLRTALVNELIANQINENIIVLTKQAPCNSGAVYYISQEGDTLQSIANIFVTVADDIYGFNGILPPNYATAGNEVDEVIEAGYILQIPEHGQVFDMPANAFRCD